MEDNGDDYGVYQRHRNLKDDIPEVNIIEGNLEEQTVFYS